MKETLQQLASEVCAERDGLLLQMEKQWGKSLSERVESGRTLGGLKVGEVDSAKKLIHFEVPREDFAFFSEQQWLRLSQNDPMGNFFKVVFRGLTRNGIHNQWLTVSCNECDDLAFSSDVHWTLDEELVDVSRFYLKAIEALGEEAHGREKVFPTLFSEAEVDVHGETYDDVMDTLEAESGGLNEHQIDAVATALASSPFHLIQGPPGTGKTYTLARMVEKLVSEEHRILVTGFTHRSIHQALGKIQQVLSKTHPDCPVVKISAPVGDSLPFPVFESFADSELAAHPGPYVIGATPFALFTYRLETAWFDSAVLDETSQLTLPAAIMVMMRSERWFFFGDHCQLPPVSLIHQDDPVAASVFGRLKDRLRPTTLDLTYRMNQSLCEWPSDQFYLGKLRTAVPVRQLNLGSKPQNYSEILDPENSLVSTAVESPGSKSRNDEEADLCADIVAALLQSGVTDTEIGVVTPFRAQASRIRTLLAGSRFKPFPDAWKNITVDTVERFQGQEREVILYSFTASNRDFITKLEQFLFQPERINLAVTRARSKVILLHSPELLAYAESRNYGDDFTSVFTSLIDYAHSIDP